MSSKITRSKNSYTLTNIRVTIEFTRPIGYRKFNSRAAHGREYRRCRDFTNGCVKKFGMSHNHFKTWNYYTRPKKVIVLEVAESVAFFKCKARGWKNFFESKAMKRLGVKSCKVQRVAITTTTDKTFETL